MRPGPTYVLGYCGIEGSREFSAAQGWGTAAYGHDAAAVLLADGEVVAAAEEERFNREKHTTRFPVGAIEYCLDEAGIGIERVDHVCYNWEHTLRSRLTVAPRVARETSVWKLPEALRVSFALERRIFSRGAVLSDFCRFTGHRVDRKRFHFVNHHLSHAASAFFGSSFPQALTITIDGMGEYDSSLIGVGRDNRIDVADRVVGPTSIGHLYQLVTEYLGFKPEYDEYKVMGMASYGDPVEYRPAFERLVRLEPGGQYRTPMPEKITIVNRSSCLDLLEGLLGPRRRPHDEVTDRHKNIAAALQEACEGVLIHLASHWQKRLGESRLCLAGGVAMNSTANGRLAGLGLFKEIFIPPVPGDNGGPLGAAWLLHHASPGCERSSGLQSAYTGPAFSREAVRAALERYRGRLVVRESSDSAKTASEAAALLAQGQVIGWFQGRMELGARALGNRSILADPRDAAMRDRVNARIKRRELFRPFAPAVLEEAAREYFDLAALQNSPYMLFVFPVREQKRAVIPAVTHVDGSARIQTVSRAQNPRFWRLIDEFRARTGVPVVLNTSFNVAGQPIVCTPTEAIESLLSTELDALVIGDFFVEAAEGRSRADRGAAGRR